MTAFTFLDRTLVELLHSRQIERFGGSYGLLDEGALESSLACPIARLDYGCEDVIELAATYLFGLARHHAFIDGNKRIAIVACAVFLMDNGFQIVTTDGILYTFVLGIAAGEIDEEGATRFLRENVTPLEETA
ncbi:type II toxin-antitoxin system death-on-curing family toxin [Rhizobium sp. Leaf341]|uniref:type II toxin-antitoxin system death-on-curing family toxin n=1 Tax=Rhizobium sp. Leaf341 TaxID=1736344 RepID=UPI000713832A|nr:type II toxin-antitoxin system death-on-curing family toxin [Rhizobium sp. Leaf341]KQR73372.1 cytochrome C biogenesis protein CcmH [Rhizobium sp. Leaf341]